MHKDYLISWIGTAAAVSMTDISAIASIGVSITTILFTAYRWKQDYKSRDNEKQ